MSTVAAKPSPVSAVSTEMTRIWPAIRKVFARSVCSAVASIDEDGFPRVTPIGSLMLRRNGTGFYFEMYAKKLGKNLQREGNVAILAVRTSPVFWLGALIRGRFKELPAVRLRARVGPMREATEKEIRAWRRRVRIFAWTRGHRLIWRDICPVRDVEILDYQPVRIGPMTKGLWRRHA